MNASTNAKRGRSTVAVLVAILIATFAARGLAEIVMEVTAPVRKKSASASATLTTFRAGLSSDDSAVLTTAVDELQPCLNDPTIVVVPKASTAGATVTVEVWLWQQVAGVNTCMGIAGVQTCTAGSLRRDGASGKYWPLQPLVFPSYGADYYEPRIRGSSGGTWDLCGWSLGASSKAAE